MVEECGNQYLAFGIDGDTFGIPVTKIREVLEYSRPTRLPKTADYLKGIINVRGVGIPVVDLRLRFGLPEIEKANGTSILVIEFEGPDGKMLIGAIADEVFEVIDIREDNLEPPPPLGAKIDSQFISRIGIKDNEFVVILDIDLAFRQEELVDSSVPAPKALS